MKFKNIVLRLVVFSFRNQHDVCWVFFQAITSAQLYVRQLAFETLHLCDKYSIPDSIPQLLTSLDEVKVMLRNICLRIAD